MAKFDNIFDAAKEGSVADVMYFVEEKGIDVNVKAEGEGVHGRTPLHFAAENRNAEIVNFLISAKANVNAKDWMDVTPLHLAAERGRVEIVQVLVSAGADVDAKGTGFGDSGTPILDETPLHWAAAPGNIEVAKILVSNGAKVNAKSFLRNKRGENIKSTPLTVAKIHGQSEMVRYLSSVGGKEDGCLVLLAVLGASLTAGICGLALFVTGMFW